MVNINADRHFDVLSFLDTQFSEFIGTERVHDTMSTLIYQKA